MIDYKELPVYKNKDEILRALKDNQVIIVESPTGSGKTTQIPLILYENGYANTGIIGITQPRRIAALSVCEFIQKQINNYSSFCAYTMRFYDTSDASTRIKIMTDGIILQEVKNDPLLSKYSVIMIDEAHERSLNIDFILGLLKEITTKRKDLKIIISSATINASVFSSFFNNAPIVSIKTHPFPVEIEYIPSSLDKESEDEFYNTIINKVKEAKKREDGGDVLIFLPGEAEIKKCLISLSLSIQENKKDYVIYPLYGRLSKEEQEKVFTPHPDNVTKVVIATNVAETSLTIDGIRTVIDSGVAKTNYYNQSNFTSSLIPTLISKSSANQRSGRAGRTQSGKCYRLYSKSNYEKRREYPEEEILHSDLAEVVLRMCEIGIYNPTSFPFITKPKEKALLSAIDTLKYIGAIEDDLHLTAIGEMMIKFPLLPRLSRVIVEAIMNYPEVLENIIIALSFLSSKTPFVMPVGEELVARDIHHALVDNQNGDFVAWLKIFNDYTSLKKDEEKERWCKKRYLDKETMDEIFHIYNQLCDIVNSMGIPIIKGSSSIKKYLICLASGLRQYICVKVDSWKYRSVRANEIYLHPGSSWFRNRPSFILCGEIVQTTKLYARSVSPLMPEWIASIDPLLLSALVDSKKKKEKKEKDVESRVEKSSLEPYRRNNKYIVPLTSLKNIKDRSATRVFLECDKCITINSYKTKKIDKELSLIKKTNKAMSKTPHYIITPFDNKERILFVLSYLFSGVRNKNSLNFIYLKTKGDSFLLSSTSSLEKAITETMYSLSSMLEILPKKEKEVRKIINDELIKIERAYGID